MFHVDAIRNPAPINAVSGDPLSAKELQEMAEEYGKFGVTYDAANGQWYFNGETVRYFRDILTSNGESLEGGKFNGAIRTLGNGNGTVDIYTVREYQSLNASGYGTLTGIDVRSRLCYYRDNNRKEIDLMILENNRLYPIEIKKSAEPGKDVLKNFRVLDSLPEEIGEGAVICMTPMVIPLDEKNKMIPVKCI